MTRNSEPNSAAYISRAITFAATKARRRKNRIGSIGAGARSSHTTNDTDASAPQAIAASTSGADQPSAPASTSPHTSPSRPALPNTTPGTSIRRCGPRLSTRYRGASTTRPTPSGTFSQKIHGQPAQPVTPPPKSGPAAAPSPPIPPHAPSTAPRRSGRVAALNNVMASGAKTAPPAPWTTRAATNTATVGARAAATEPSAKSAIPAVNMRRRPKRSPSAAPVSRSTAKVSV